MPVGYIVFFPGRSSRIYTADLLRKYVSANLRAFNLRNLREMHFTFQQTLASCHSKVAYHQLRCILRCGTCVQYLDHLAVSFEHIVTVGFISQNHP